MSTKNVPTKIEDCISCPELRKELVEKIERKIDRYNSSDAKYCRAVQPESNEPLTSQWVIDRLLAQKNECCWCNKQLLLVNYRPYDPDQFSIDRLDNKLGHTQDNCVISCYKCNADRGAEYLNSMLEYRKKNGLPIDRYKQVDGRALKYEDGQWKRFKSFDRKLNNNFVNSSIDSSTVESYFSL